MIPPTSDPITVLIVEDEAHIRRLIEYALVTAGFNVTTAVDGEEGLNAAKKGKFQLVLLDVMMPKKNGLEVLTTLKAMPSYKNVPIFMLTALSMVGDMETAFQSGADDYITKPFDPLTLGVTIRRKLEKFRERSKQ